MIEWPKNYSWVIAGVCGAIAYVCWRMSTDRIEGSFFRRVLYALFPAANPKSGEYQPITPRTLWIVGIGLVIILIANLLAPS